MAARYLCDASVNDILLQTLHIRADEVDWPSYFSVCVEYAMAVVFATALARDQSISNIMQTQYLMLLAKARSTDLNNNKPHEKLQHRGLLQIGVVNAKARIPITNFQYGEISPSLVSRTDSAYL